MGNKRDYSQVFVVVGAIVEKDGKILLVKETKEIANGLWSYPAGWLEMGENPVVGAIREVEEETGHRFEPTHILGIYSLHKKNLKERFDITPHQVQIIFSGLVSGEMVRELADDVSETRWFAPEEIYQMGPDELRDIDIKQMIRDYFAGNRYPLELINHTVSE